jgi:hypothetical protein
VAAYADEAPGIGRGHRALGGRRARSERASFG